MSTRKLILLALACGLAILVAGSIQLLRINNNRVSTLGEGDTTELSTARVTVAGSDVRDGAVLVQVQVSQAATASAPIADAAQGWSLLTGGQKQPVPAGAAPPGVLPSCAGTAVPPGGTVDCVLRFAVEPTASGTSYATYVFVGARATWLLAV